MIFVFVFFLYYLLFCLNIYFCITWRRVCVRCCDPADTKHSTKLNVRVTINPMLIPFISFHWFLSLLYLFVSFWHIRIQIWYLRSLAYWVWRRRREQQKIRNQEKDSSLLGTNERAHKMETVKIRNKEQKRNKNNHARRRIRNLFRLWAHIILLFFLNLLLVVFSFVLFCVTSGRKWCRSTATAIKAMHRHIAKQKKRIKKKRENIIRNRNLKNNDFLSSSSSVSTYTCWHYSYCFWKETWKFKWSVKIH